jgi:hypothetical protein
LFACSISFSQNQVSLSGTVKSSRTTAAISGATVRLVSLSLGTSTDAEGRFNLLGTTGVHRSAVGQGLTDPNVIRFRQEADGPIIIRILDLKGVQKTVVHSGLLPAGTWNVTLPRLAGGVYFCTFDSPSSRESVRFLAPPGSQPATGSAPSPIRTAVASRSLAGSAIDSLLVTKTGYRSSRVPLSSYQQTGIDIQLDDSSATNLDQSTIVPDPSWPCLMADGIPPPQSGTLAFHITLKIGAIHDVGLTRFGQRRQYDISGGSVTGDKLTATIQTGGLDYDLTLTNGSKEIEQILILQAGTTPILMRNPGVAPIGATNARMVVDFEAPNSSSYTWLNTGKFAATRIVDTVAKTIQLDVYDISKAVLPATRVQIKDPTGDENQSWDCVSQTGGNGTTVFTENVTLASSVSIGASKRGSRNIIPITGGTTTGRVAGKILVGGGDYQLGGLDARYTLAPSDGELIIVRNCGPGTLYPVFEARVAGPYNFLNQNKYVSSSPNVGAGGVSITFYDKK